MKPVHKPLLQAFVSSLRIDTHRDVRRCPRTRSGFGAFFGMYPAYCFPLFLYLWHFIHNLASIFEHFPDIPGHLRKGLFKSLWGIQLLLEFRIDANDLADENAGNSTRPRAFGLNRARRVWSRSGGRSILEVDELLVELSIGLWIGLGAIAKANPSGVREPRGDLAL
jgi:hypothetical protein